IFRSGAGGASNDDGTVNDGQKELTGLQTIVDDTEVLHTLDPASVPVWKAYVDSNSGTLRSWSEQIAMKACQRIERAGGEQIDLMVSNDGVWRAIMAFYAAQRRQLDKVELKGGWSGLQF